MLATFEEEDGVKNLMIIIDKMPYVDLDTCVLASHIINPILDEADLIEKMIKMRVVEAAIVVIHLAVLQEEIHLAILEVLEDMLREELDLHQMILLQHQG